MVILETFISVTTRWLWRMLMRPFCLLNTRKA